MPVTSPPTRLRRALLVGTVFAGAATATVFAAHEGGAEPPPQPRVVAAAQGDVRPVATPEPDGEPTSAATPEATPAPEATAADAPTPAATPEATTAATPASQQDTVWDALAECEASGNWQETSGTFEGGLQFHPATWDAYRPAGYPDAAYEATRTQQIAVAEQVLADQGWEAWPACSYEVGAR